MKELEFKPLVPEQIEVRPTDTKTRGTCTLLLYIDSRCAHNILNDTVGVFNWKIEYRDEGELKLGRLSIYNEERQEWVYREDTGSASNIEANKGLTSDILKRCLARWGCDYLYSSPKIKINCPDSYYFNDKMTMSFHVTSINYKGKTISELTIADRFGNTVFNYPKTTTTPVITQNESSPESTGYSPQQQQLIQFCDKKSKEGMRNKAKAFYRYYITRVDKYNIDLNNKWENWK